MASHLPRHPSHGHTNPFPLRQQRTAPQASDTENSFIHVLKSALFAIPFSFLCGLVLLSVLAGLAFTQPDPDSLTTPLSLVVLGLSAAMGGLICTRRCGHSALSCGLSFGLLFALCTWVLSLFIHEPSDMALSLPITLLLRASVVVLSCLGARMGVNRQHAPSHRHAR